LEDDAWRLMEERLPDTWWFDWDYCQRMRTGTVEAFIERELSTSTFGQLTRDESVFAQLTEIAARSYRGRRYLSKVRRALQESNKPELSGRISLLLDLE
jgi:hypothetical protein